jgi:hypothetical protein
MARSIGQAIQEREDELRFASSLDGIDEPTNEILEILSLAKVGLWAEEECIPALRAALNAIEHSNVPEGLKIRLREVLRMLRTKASLDAGF